MLLLFATPLSLIPTFLILNGEKDTFPDLSVVLLTLLRFILSFYLLKKGTLAISQWTSIKAIVVGGYHWRVTVSVTL